MDQANESIRDMKRILEDQYKFTEMCRDLLNSIPEDLKEQQDQHNLLTMISECIDLSYSIEIDPERLGKFVDEYVGNDVE